MPTYKSALARLQSMAPSMHRFTQSQLLPIGIILLVTVLARAIRVWQLGLYWDDWRILIYGAQYGSFGVFTHFASERILMGAPLAILFAMFGPNPLAWHVANVCLEFGIAVVIFGLLRRLVPDYPIVSVLASCLFVVYPLSVIRTHMINVYINSALLMAVLSLYLTSYACQEERVGQFGYGRTIVTLLAAILVPIYLLMYEAPIGLELVRIYLLWAVVKRWRVGETRTGYRMWMLGRQYAPYTMGLLIFAGLRIFAYPEIVKAFGISLRPYFDIGTGILALPSLEKVARSVFETMLPPWLNAWNTLLHLPRPYSWTYPAAWILSIIAFVMVNLYALRWSERLRRQSDASITEFPRATQWLLWAVMGSVAVCAALAPILVYPDTTVLYANYSSRNGYVATTAAAVTWVCIIGYFATLLVGEQRRHSALVVGSALMIGLGVGHNFLLGDAYISEWRNTKATWQQILTRAPNIAKGTLLVVSRPDELKALGITFRHQDIYEPAQLFYGLRDGEIMGSPVNRLDKGQSIVSWIGLGEWRTREVAEPKIQGGNMDDPEPTIQGGTLVHRDRLLILDENEGCVKALDSRRVIQDVASPQSNALAQFSNVEVINPVKTDDRYDLRERLLGRPKEDWCYFYEKASLLQQQGKWEEIVAIYGLISARKLRPSNPVEWLPFIEALDRTANFDVADQLFAGARAGPAYSRRVISVMLEQLAKGHGANAWHVERIERQMKLLGADLGDFGQRPSDTEAVRDQSQSVGRSGRA